MSSSSMFAREVRPVRRARHRVTAGVAAVTMSGVAVVGAAVPAQARARSCNDIANTIMFMELAMETSTGAQYATELRYWSINTRLYYASGC